MHNWVIEMSERFLKVGAETVCKTLESYESVPGDVIVDKWTNDELARSIAVHQPRPAACPGL